MTSRRRIDLEQTKRSLIYKTLTSESDFSRPRQFDSRKLNFFECDYDSRESSIRAVGRDKRSLIKKNNEIIET